MIVKLRGKFLRLSYVQMKREIDCNSQAVKTGPNVG
tara:strand:+ start:496 stop:603 length:108 start_codon:yes stop_codon:yes gene_type:complete